MKRSWLGPGFTLALAFSIGCTPAAPSPAPPKPAASPAAQQPAPAKPAASPAARPAAWEQEWERVLAEARKEGVVAVSGPVGNERREALTQPFQAKHPDIRVEYAAPTAAVMIPRVSAEREAGQYLWDVMVEGIGPDLSWVPRLLDPLEPALILPEVKEPRNWRSGELEFVDEGRRLLVMTPSHRGTLFVNRNSVNLEEFKSYKDLLDSKWKGRLLFDDPRIAGPGNATFTFFYMHPELGPDFIRALGQQEPTLLRDYAQEMDGLGQGRYPVLLGGSDATAEARMKLGVPIHIVDIRQLREGSDVSPASGIAALFNRAPHPNAAKVYLNFLLSKEGQTPLARASAFVSARLDVSTDHAPAWRVPTPGAIKTYSLEALKVRANLIGAVVEEVFGK